MKIINKELLAFAINFYDYIIMLSINRPFYYFTLSNMKRFTHQGRAFEWERVNSKLLTMLLKPNQIIFVSHDKFSAFW